MCGLKARVEVLVVAPNEYQVIGQYCFLSHPS